MFDSEFAAASDEEVVAAIEDGARQEAIGGARRLAAVAELTRRRVVDDDERVMWAFDPWDSAAAEVAAALHIGHRRASGQMRIAQALRDRLPQVAALYWKGAISSRVVSAITWGTHLVEDEHALALIDTAITDRATRWDPLSEDKLRQAVDTQVNQHDPDAVRRAQTSLRGRDFTIGACDDDTDTTAVWGRLRATDAAVLNKRITAMTGEVCQDDPRSAGERRSDAAGSWAHGNDHLACACGSPTCRSSGQRPTANVVIRVITDQHTLDAAATAAAQPGAALMMGHGAVSAPLLAQAIGNGATVTPIRMPSGQPEKGYRPSAELAEFVRMRDLFCRFPGCDISAERCDIDHARPWPLGPTHASNLNCKCRKHHLMKTFWTGIGGWSDIQLPDGTLIWTSPSGTRYPTYPGSRIFFPGWDVTTAELDLPPPTQTAPPTRALMMPRRHRTRTADQAARIKTERALNVADPPPF
jgi:hypothetical protein